MSINSADRAIKSRLSLKAELQLGAVCLLLDGDSIVDEALTVSSTSNIIDILSKLTPSPTGCA